MRGFASSDRGFALIFVLLLIILLLAVGMAFMGKRSPQYDAAYQASLQVQARALAEAGLEDAHQKFMKDLNFPPLGDRDQTLFSYSEEVREVGSEHLVGYYFVTVDTSWSKRRSNPMENFPPIITVTSKGVLGSDIRKPAATSRLKMEIEVDINDPPTQPMRLTDWVEDGELPTVAPPAPF